MKPPITVIIAGCIYILGGAIPVAYQINKIAEISSNHDMAWVVGLGVLAVIGGIYVIRGANWARWLLLAWIIFHVVISFYGDTMKIIGHSLFAVLTYILLFNKRANTYF